ncbi:hypothetical protein, variant [Saprolegnia diclina VS20]|uniref:Centrosomal protein of 162 kDa n=1 Tax=Saprolegnia diclina (strain VS20) TaxID=1156394 RepID=T0R8I0_SAPDV|nr:hypothetical protein, variant [Saprolegnia diclina VS20]EQC42780.1 hypothetical protein, variant [Saprolegnia diclina VS20]|eukprot:XP_008604203.1 hypothetical protein, variant [Saprolegnia diclina VS20]
MSSDDEFERFLEGDSDDEHAAFAKAKKKKQSRRTSTAEMSRPTLDDSDDPYNFEMRPAATSESDEDTRPKPKARTKPVTLSRKLSLEERMADILKRHGSALADAVAPFVEAPAAAASVPEEPPAVQLEPATQEPSSDESSDSLGMESADFEVGGYAKKPINKASVEVPFTVDVAVTSAPAEPFRYADAAAEKLAETSTPAPFESAFAKMKDLFSLEPSLEKEVPPVETSDASDDYGDEFEAVPDATEDNVMDMYDDDGFEESADANGMTPPLSPPPPPPPVDFEPDEASPPMSPGPPPPPDLPLADSTDPVRASEAVNPVVADVPSYLSFLQETSEAPAYNLRAVTVEAELTPPIAEEVVVELVDGPSKFEATLDVDAVISDTVLSIPPAVVPTVGPVASPVATHTATFHATSTAAQLPAADRFRQLQATLDAARVSHDDQVTNAFERDKILIRAFANKENEMKLELQAAQREILSLQHERDALSVSQDVHTLSDARLLGKYVHSQTRHGVAMTSAAYDTMRKEMETQEGLIQGYQLENERLMQQLKDMRRDLHYDVHAQNEAHLATIKDLRHQLQKQQQIQARPPLDVTLAADVRILALQEELRDAVDLHATHERELKVELDMVKKAKKDLECQIAGVHMDVLQRENDAYDQLRAASVAQQHDAEAKIAALQSKLDWYIQNQRYLDEQDELLRQQRATIDDLRRQPRSETSAKPSRAADRRRIQALEGQIAEMERAMQKRHPDSLVNLILASKPTADDQLAECKRMHELQVHALQEQLRTAEHSHELKLTAFRQQHERIVAQLRAQLDAKLAASSDRTTLTAKIKELEKKLQDARGRKPPPISDDSPSFVARLKKQVTDLTTELASVQQQLSASDEARRLLIQSSSVVVSPSVSQASYDALVTQVHDLEREMESVRTRHATELREAKDLLHEEILRVTQMLAVAHNDLHKAQATAGRIPYLETQVCDLTRQLEVPNTPSMLQYKALELQVHALMQKYAVRETELQALLQQATASSHLEQAALRAHYEHVLTLKNADITRFQLQLDEMLDELKSLRP